MVGTPAYLSPAQITGGRVPIDQRTDVSSLRATTLYELLTLRPPFVAERPVRGVPS
jgi:serine/threonine protein kinase